MADPAETSVWSWATNVTARELAFRAAEVCTCCRSAFAGAQLDGYRSIPKPFPADPFQAMLRLAHAGVETPAFYQSMSSPDFVESLVAYASSNAFPPVEVARTWEVVGRKGVKVSSITPVYAFKLRRRSEYLLVSLDEQKKPRFGARQPPGRSVAGPAAMSSWRPALPAPHQPAVRVQADREPVTGRARYRSTLLFRVPDLHPSALHVGTYAEVLFPIMGKA